MLEVHAAASSSNITSYHEFLARFSKTKNVVYGFVEGKEDSCVYSGFINSFLPDDWKVELWPAGNRDRVLSIHNKIDWRYFPKERICFFIDRDLSDLIPQKLREDRNIYVTDKYSIENDIVNRETCQRVLTEVFGFSDVSHDEMDNVCDKFEIELENFFLAMKKTMAQILSWRRTPINANLKNINISKMVAVDKGVVVFDNSDAANIDRNTYIHKSAGVTLDPTSDISAEESEFAKASVYRKFVRGKYVLWFFVEFCKSVHKAASQFFSACSNSPKMKVVISASNAVTVIGKSTRIPKSLRNFLTDTYFVYINNHTT
jgi:hypothetical protein